VRKIYFDVVLDKNAKPVFSSTRKEVVAWLKLHSEAFGPDACLDFDVCLGLSLQVVTVPHYLEAIEYWKNRADLVL
jgi:hypothetical protein